jgi:SAM-dependent methyltransferase
MGFDRHWLELRETVDRKARDRTLLAAANEAITEARSDIVLDIGCGTGSTYRSMEPYLPSQVVWRLLDNDQSLLDEVEARHGDAVEIVKMDVNRVEALPLEGVGMVTASALFDLCSADFIQRLCRRLSDADAGLYAALSYDGEMTWADAHPLDGAVTQAFNAHQRSDKGLGVSLGPDAWEMLAECAKAEGYKVQTAESPWMLTGDELELHLLLLQGIAAAVEETGQLDNKESASWLAYRRQSAIEGRGLCRIGHRDLLALR